MMKQGGTVRRTVDPASQPAQTIHFQYVEELDLLIATPFWELESTEGVETWYRQYETLFASSFDRPVDTIFDLSYFHVGRGVGVTFGGKRAEVIKNFTRRTYRCHNKDERAKTYMYTSAVKYNTEANEYPTFEAAVEALLADRAKTE